MRDRVDGPDRPDGVRAGAGQDETAPGVPDAAAIRRALAECMTLSDIDDAMGWARGTARKRRWRAPAAGGLPPADAELGGVALWFRATITHWNAEQHAPTERPGPDALQPARTPPEHTPAAHAQTAPPADEHARPASDDTAQPAHPGPSPRAAAGDNADTEPESEVAPRQAATDAHASTAEQRPASEPSDATPAAVDEGDRDGDGVTEVSDDIASTEVVHSGFQLELGQHVLAYVHGTWQPAVVASRDRRTVVIDYQLNPGPLGARRQRVAIDRVRPTDPAA